MSLPITSTHIMRIICNVYTCFSTVSYRVLLTLHPLVLLPRLLLAGFLGLDHTRVAG